MVTKHSEYFKNMGNQLIALIDGTTQKMTEKPVAGAGTL